MLDGCGATPNRTYTVSVDKLNRRIPSPEPSVPQVPPSVFRHEKKGNSEVNQILAQPLSPAEQFH